MSITIEKNLNQIADRTDLGELSEFLPVGLPKITNPQTDVPNIAKDEGLVRLIRDAVQRVPTEHRLYLGDARLMSALEPESVHLVLTSPPYWTLKEYRDSKGQLGHVTGYEAFLSELDNVWSIASGPWYPAAG